VKEDLLRVVRAVPSPAAAVNVAREYLQARVLLAMQDAGAMIPLAFQGGTALRFLFDLPRFSEDLDFALERQDRGSFDVAAVDRRIRASLAREGYAVETRPKTHGAVQYITVSFPGLLFAAGLSARRAQVVRIRVEVDMRPPAGAGLDTSIVRRHALLHLQHHDRASLLAGKLHAVLQRKWTKGRDLFDLFWYLSDRRWPGPNLVLLNNSLQQTGWDGAELDATSWRPTVAARVRALDWTAAERDVSPFLEPGPAASLFGRDAVLSLLQETG
jgi:hypothetical protein